MSYIIANWKMHFTLAESTRLSADITEGVKDTKNTIVLCPPFTTLHAVRDVLEEGTISLGAQDVFYEAEGAYTGEISAGMLADANCKYVLVGHSERRHLGDTNDDIRKKIKTALQFGLTPIVCVGESLADRKAKTGEEFVASQIRSALNDVGSNNLLLAYEPIWAIGTGEEANSDQVIPMLNMIKQTLSSLKLDIGVLYGGSVNSENALGFVADGFDGVLVGSSSLKSESFLELIKSLD